MGLPKVRAISTGRPSRCVPCGIVARRVSSWIPVDPIPFNIELYVSGFASRTSGQGFGSRAGKAFLRLAKSKSYVHLLIDSALTVIEQAMPLSPNWLQQHQERWTLCILRGAQQLHRRGIYLI